VAAAASSDISSGTRAAGPGENRYDILSGRPEFAILADWVSTDAWLASNRFATDRAAYTNDDMLGPPGRNPDEYP
jgi:hypothetical protein